jgi:hypothetical protein
VITRDATDAELDDGASKVCEFAESISAEPGVAATILSQAVVMYAVGQDEPDECLVAQARYLYVWLGRAIDRKDDDEARRDLDRAVAVCVAADALCEGDTAESVNALIHALMFQSSQQERPAKALAVVIDELQRALKTMPDEIAARVS